MDNFIIIFIIAILLLISGCYLFILLKKDRKTIIRLKKDNTHNAETINKLTDNLEALTKKVRTLEPYQKIEDIKIEIERRKAEYNKRLSEAKAEAKGYARKKKADADEYADFKKKEADEDAKIMIQKAKEKSSKMTKSADDKFNAAVDYYNMLTTKAELRAKEIDEAAYISKGKADLFEKAFVAIKNGIDGYHDDYIIPGKTVLDDLAEEFGSKDASVKYKAAKANTVKMVKEEKAADCDYVETYRKTTAIRFVLDAFNGKVDVALSKVKHNNYGKLKQEIEDAFNLVNMNGKPFRDAKILPVYLEARLDELKWAVAVHELKMQEIEEQRQIREAMREEAKAKKEYETAMKEAVKEEKMLRDAKAKAEEQLKQATEEQRQEFEQQIAELQQKLTEVEEKNQRAVSMAQMTKQGHVYIISNVGSFGERVYKIGLTRRLEPEIRVRELGDASVPFPFDIHAMIFSEDSPSLESQLHQIFEDHRVNKINLRKEFFETSISEIKEKVEQLGIEAHWTLAAEAKEYKESMAMKKAS
ncbi:DUF4041 domain-containing protein [uncultured Desulfobacter sp.]|uniref:DUF4041 domain-containing protein n=1 Tax=uncultured Desulfobacter sp. TaxID=240139 RepID=UPI0029F5A4F8|nr:DUF4041 domain-containing protein [uncultured Desulfobacter sp.]